MARSNPAPGFLTSRHTLKADTLCAHALAEQKVLGGLASFETRAQYQRYLSAAQFVHLTYGLPACRACLGEDALGAERDRIFALADDLGQIQPPEAPEQTIAPDIGWGVLYALNGSALGAGHLLKTGQIPEDWPTKYLDVMWRFARDGGLKRFFDALNHAAPSRPQARHGGQIVFDHFVARFNTSPMEDVA